MGYLRTTHSQAETIRTQTYSLNQQAAELYDVRKKFEMEFKLINDMKAEVAGKTAAFSDIVA